MRLVRSLLTVAAAAGIAACATENAAYDLVQYSRIDGQCFADAPKRLDGVNWTRAKVVNVEIKDGQFSGYGIDLKLGQPTILRLVNKDDTQRTFGAEDFLRAVALEQASGSFGTLTRPCIVGFGIGAGRTAELRLVPVKEGWYYPEDSLFWYFGPREVLSFGGLGIITVSR